VGGVSFVILLIWLKIETPKTPLIAGLCAIDWTGTVTIIGGTVMLLFGLEFGGVSHPWDSPTVICLIIFGIVTIGLFMVNEWKFAKYPIVPMRIFKDPSNIAVFLLCAVHAFVFISGSYYLPLYFQTVLLASPILSGVYTLPFVLALSFSSAGVGAIIRKTGRYIELIQFGVVFMTLGFGLFIDLKPYASWPRIIIFQIIAGIGVGPNFQSPLIALQSNIKTADMATATATFGFVRQLSTSMSVVLGGVVYQNFLHRRVPAIVAALGPDVAASFSGSFSNSNRGVLKALPTEQRQVVLDAYTYALSREWIFYVAIAGVGCVLSLFIRRVELSKKHEVTKTGLAEQERARLERKAEEKQEKLNKEGGDLKEQV
jgi:hypothetical protein